MGTLTLPRRWLAFNGVGLLGVGVQLGLVALLVHGCGVSDLLATAIAVEMTVLHNFVWHQHWTWRDRPSATARDVAGRLVRFHLLNGTVSLGGNLADRSRSSAARSRSTRWRPTSWPLSSAR